MVGELFHLIAENIVLRVYSLTLSTFKPLIKSYDGIFNYTKSYCALFQDVLSLSSYVIQEKSNGC